MHTIRLGPPWEIVETPGGGTVHTRRFGAPPRLDPATRVTLRLAGASGVLSVTLNGLELAWAADGAGVTAGLAGLRPRNAVAVTLAAGGGLGEGRLEFGSVEC